MLFNSYEFLFLYLPLVLTSFFWLARFGNGLAAGWLTVASLFFYGWWNPAYVFLLLTSIALNFVMGQRIQKARNPPNKYLNAKVVFGIAVAINLMLLAYYKYCNFFISTVNDVSGANWRMTEVVLPLGISFFTFTQIAFLADVYRGAAREYSLVNYSLFVTYFPHLIAGPLLHHKQMMPQFEKAATYRLNLENVNTGVFIFTIGLFKKVMLADQFSLYANPVFDVVAQGGEPGLIESWTGATAYALQLYFDFSGYSDMAIGIALLFNVRLPENFNSPYKSANIIEFWRRWHMTLSAFLRDYLYIPLGGNQKGPLRRHANLLVTMLLGGLWHGASWTFVIWGGLHGIYLILNHSWQWIRQFVNMPVMPAGRIIAAGLTFGAVVVAWVPFRASSIDAAWRMICGMAGLNGVLLPQSSAGLLAPLADLGAKFTGAYPLTGQSILETALWLAGGLFIVWCIPNVSQMVSDAASAQANGIGSRRLFWRPSTSAALATGTLLAISCLGISRASQFLYFQF